MSDLIDRQAAIDAVEKESRVDGAYGYMDTKSIVDLLNDLPSAQTDTDIIVCADCKHWICHDRRCGYWNHGVRPLDWCSHAETRKKDE